MLLAETVGTAASGMAGITDQLVQGVTAQNLFGTVGELFPFIIVMIGFAFGYKVLRKVVKAASKGKAAA